MALRTRQGKLAPSHKPLSQEGDKIPTTVLCCPVTVSPMSGSDGILGMKAGLEEKWAPNTNRKHYFTEKLEDIGGMNSVIWYPSNKGWRNTCSLHLCQSPPHCSAPPGLQLLVAIPEGKWELAEVSTGAAGPEETVTSGVGRGGGR